MAKIEATMSAGFQITVPSAVRKLLDLKPGDKLVFDAEDIEVDGADVKVKRMAVEKALTREEQVKKLFADLDEWREGLSDETKRLIQERAGWTASQLREHIDNQSETMSYRKEKYGIKA